MGLGAHRYLAGCALGVGNTPRATLWLCFSTFALLHWQCFLHLALICAQRFRSSSAQLTNHSRQRTHRAETSPKSAGVYIMLLLGRQHTLHGLRPTFTSETNSWGLKQRRVVEVRANLAVLDVVCFPSIQRCTGGNIGRTRRQSQPAYSFDSGGTHAGWLPTV